MNILLIEDDRLIAEGILEALTGWRHKAEWSVTGRDALERIKQRDFDLILMDVFLPDFHGYELIPLLKKFQPDTGIITMTNSNSRELELQVRKQGIVYYMLKPISMEIMEEILHHLSTAKSVRGAKQWQN